VGSRNPFASHLRNRGHGVEKSRRRDHLIPEDDSCPNCLESYAILREDDVYRCIKCKYVLEDNE